MLRLIAIAPEDGWAFVKEEGSIHLIRPPYRKNNVSIASEATVEKAISTQGFVSEQKDFPDWRSLITDIQNRLIEARKEQGQSVPGPEAAQKLIQYAPQHIVESYLDRVETDLFPDSKWDAAMDLLLALLKSKRVKAAERLRERTTSLLEKCWELHQKQERNKLDLIGGDSALAEQLPRVTQRHTTIEINKYVSEMSESGSLMTAGM